MVLIRQNFDVRRMKMGKKFLFVFLMVFIIVGFASAIDIRDSSNRIVGCLDGNTIKDSSNRIIGRIDGDAIKDASNRIIGRVNGTPTQVKMAALLSFFFFYLL
jgi:hypothetical protein